MHVIYGSLQDRLSNSDSIESDLADLKGMRRTAAKYRLVEWYDKLGEDIAVLESSLRDRAEKDAIAQRAATKKVQEAIDAANYIPNLNVITHIAILEEAIADCPRASNIDDARELLRKLRNFVSGRAHQVSSGNYGATVESIDSQIGDLNAQIRFNKSLLQILEQDIEMLVPLGYSARLNQKYDRRNALLSEQSRLHEQILALKIRRLQIQLAP